jgi:hypothetical protein
MRPFDKHSHVWSRICVNTIERTFPLYALASWNPGWMGIHLTEILHTPVGLYVPMHRKLGKFAMEDEDLC